MPPDISPTVNVRSGAPVAPISSSEIVIVSPTKYPVPGLLIVTLLSNTLPFAFTVISNVALSPAPLVPSLTVTAEVIGSIVVTVVGVTPAYVPAAAALVPFGAPPIIEESCVI